MKGDSTISKEEKRHILFPVYFRYLAERALNPFIPKSLLVKFGEHFETCDALFYASWSFFLLLHYHITRSPPEWIH